MRGRGWLVAAALLLPAAWIPATVATLSEPRSSEASPRHIPSPAPAAAPATAEGEPLAAFATFPGLTLHLPAERVEKIAFHEASMPGALPMRPVGRCRPCRHPRFRPGGSDGPLEYAVMHPRGRGSAPTSAVDVLVRRGEPVLAPVTGRVTAARSYRLYGRHPDQRVAIVPDGAEGIEVVILHLRGVRLARGDRVVASATPLGRARRLPLTSQVDRYVAGGGHPHVHIEVVDVQARREAKERERRHRAG